MTEHKPEYEFNPKGYGGSKVPARDRNITAKLMLQWADLKANLDKLEEQIERDVLDDEKTFVVGSIKASYFKASQTYDYLESAIGGGELVTKEIEKENTKLVTDWRGVCKDAGIEIFVVKAKKPARVVIRMEAPDDNRPDESAD